MDFLTGKGLFSMIRNGTFCAQNAICLIKMIKSLISVFQDFYKNR